MQCAIRYKLLVLFGACVTELLRGALITGTLPIYPTYYIEQYRERVLSTTIGSAQRAVSFLVGTCNGVSAKHRGGV